MADQSDTKEGAWQRCEKQRELRRQLKPTLLVKNLERRMKRNTGTEQLTAV